MSLFGIGIQSIFDGVGVARSNAMPVVTFPGLYIPVAGLKPIPHARFYEPYVNAALGAGATVTLNAGNSGQYQLLTYLNVWCSIAQELQFFMGPVNYIPVFMAANTQRDILLPSGGLISESDNQDFKVTNPGVAPASVVITFSCTMITTTNT